MVSTLYGTAELSEQKVNDDIELDFHSVENGYGPKVSKNVRYVTWNYVKYVTWNYFLIKSKRWIRLAFASWRLEVT